MGIDISKYQADVSQSENTGFLNREINLMPWRFGDKKKHALYNTLALLMRAGLDLRSALDMIVEEQSKKKDAEFLTSISNKVVAGQTFSKVLEEKSDFSAYEYQSIRIGEESGRLAEVLDELASYYEGKIKLRRLLTKVLAYPLFILFVSIFVIWFMMIYVVPLFKDVFARFDAELPAVTQTVISLSEWFSSYFGMLLIGILGVVVVLRISRNHPLVRKWRARISLGVPFFGSLTKKLYLARFCQSMHLLTKAHTPLLRSIKLTRNMISLQPLEEALDDVQKSVTKGHPLYRGMQEHGIFEKRMISLLRVAEEVNQLDQMFGQLAKQYTDEAEHKSSMASSVLEPVLILFIALFVGFILIAMYLPLFELSNAIG